MQLSLAFRGSPESLRIALEIAVATILAAVVAWICISLSLETGRLSLPAGYDDVAYLIAGQDWLNTSAGRGVFGDLWALLNQHAPLSTAIAAFGFAVMGPYDWVPYAGNGVLLAFTCWVVLRELRQDGLPLAASAVLLLVLAAIPFFQHAVTEFRPDIFTGIVTAFAAIAPFRRPIFQMPARQQFYVGLLFGLALLAKPSAFFVSGFIIAVAVLLSYAGFVWQSRLPLKRQIVPILKSFGYLLLGAAVVFGPYLAAQGRKIFEYIYLALFTLSDVNAYPGGFATQVLAYSTGPFGASALGFWLWVGLVAMLARLVVTASTAPRELFLLGGSYVVLLVTYAVLSAASVKSYFLGSTFFATFSFLSIRDLGWLMNRSWTTPKIVGLLYGLIAVAVLVAVQQAAFPSPFLYSGYYADTYKAAVTSATADIWQLASERIHARPQSAAPFVILVNNGDPVRTEALVLEGKRKSLNIESSAKGIYARSTEEFVMLAEKADLIVVTASMDVPYPGGRLGNDFGSALDADQRFRFVRAIANNYVHIYERSE